MLIITNLTLYIIRKITKLSCREVNRYYPHILLRSKDVPTTDRDSFLHFLLHFSTVSWNGYYSMSVSASSLDKTFLFFLTSAERLTNDQARIIWRDWSSPVVTSYFFSSLIYMKIKGPPGNTLLTKFSATDYFFSIFIMYM